MAGGISRRSYLKIAALTGGGIAAAGIGLPLLIREQKAAFEPNDSYWALEQPPPSAQLREDLDVDVAVIGGGYTGLSSALHLAESAPGLRIALLEARQIGHGASGRHGGMVLPQFGAESFEIAHDLETHKQTYDLTVRGMDSMRRLVESSGMECDLRLDGFIHAFLDEEDWEYYEEYVAEVRDAGMPLELMDEDETAQALGTEIYAGGVYDPNGGSVHAMKLARVLKNAAEDAGVVIYGDSPVRDVTEGKKIVMQVGDSKHTVRAGAVVLATNAYTSKLGLFRSQVMPVHAQTAVTPPLSRNQLQAIGWESRLPFYDSRNALFHVVLTLDNRIVIGGGNAEYFFANDVRFRGDMSAISEMMLAELVRMYPPLKGIRFEYVWNGLLGVSFDGTPAVGVTGKHRNVYYGLAYNGQGVNLAFVFGEVIAALYLGEHHPWLDTLYAGHTLPYIPPEPYRWLGAKLMMRYYGWQDKE